MSDFWKDRRVIVTGGAGFLGRQIVPRLESMGASVFVPRKAQYDLTKFDDCTRMFKEHPADMVIHAAAYYGGIWINQLYPGRIYYENLVMGAHLMEAARLADVKKFVQIGTACSYPGYLEGKLKEENLWDGPLHESVFHYGLTKKILNIQGKAYKKQYDFDSIHLILTNLYGPYDTFNPDRSHVVSALIRKVVEAKLSGAPEVEVWGTGRPIREFLYVEDCAEAIILASEKYNDLMPMNIGTGIGTTIKELIETICDVADYKGALRWNTSKPDGQYEKVLDVTRMKEILDYSPRTSLKDGLLKTVSWYMENKEEADKRP